MHDMAQPKSDLILPFLTQATKQATAQETVKIGFAKTGMRTTFILVKQKSCAISPPQQTLTQPSTTAKTQPLQPFPVATGRVRSLCLPTHTAGTSTRITVVGAGTTVVPVAGSGRCA